MNFLGKVDSIAIILSSICLIHCLAIPILFLVGSTVAMGFFETELLVHVLLLMVAAPMSGYALVIGYRTHRSAIVLYLGLVGLTLMLSGVIFHGQFFLEVVVTIAGSLVLGLAHIYNLRFTKTRKIS